MAGIGCNRLKMTGWMAMTGDVLALVLVLVVVGFQAVTQGKNKLPHDYYTLEPQFY